ncbi:hypothetical protein B0T19DRAFT_399965 [Cercophora scortea]|uniref:BZIP domain-containing protein n=1 Tax=Cercophora scortea TaxID=314031 RepID=A0AAE0ILM6_9PEZI|nr:hypothetical protein B0T19DRAFT_399965 [Cercophora scortea]
MAPTTCTLPNPMSSQKQQTSNSGTKTLRLTENKRRYRARRKEYISDLETKLVEAREQGVQATKEVQLAARQVVVENGRLRDLLRLAGFSDADIDGWRGRGAGCDGHGGDDVNAMSSCDRRLHLEVTRKARQCATALATLCSEAAAANIPATDAITMTREEGAPVLEEAENTCHSRTSPDDNLNHIVPSCKLLTRLAENPAADITQVPVIAPPNPDEDEDQDADAPPQGDGIECRKAYDMLIQYATSEEKMDTIARALESGCTKNGKGGCAVKSKVVLQALDDMCG